MSKPRRTHRKRLSAVHLSTDTCSSLPEYQLNREHIVHSDEPPDYPDSAEEADEDTDPDVNFVEVPQLPSPRRAKRFLPSHKRRLSSQHQLSSESTDPHLDSLLERSIHALEMSNTLLQSSISTQTSLSTVLALDSPGDLTLEARARNLSSRIKNNWDVQAVWADDLEEISRNVEGLFKEDTGHSRRNSVRSVHQEDAISCSLPSSSSPTTQKNLRRPSLDLRQASANISADRATVSPRLHYSSQSRSHLIAPPPRALTQYVASTQDSESILLPSTLGLRSSSSVHHTSDWRTLSECASSSTTSLLSAPSLPPKLTDKPLEPSTPAYTMLSSFVYRPPSGSPTPSTSFTPSFISRRRNNSSASTERGHSRTPRRLSSSPASCRSSDKLHHQGHCGSCSACVSAVPGCLLTETPKRGVSPVALHRPMTPPVEESSSSSDGCVAKRTVQSLRKILDDQATLQPNGHVNGASSSRSSSRYRARLRAPAFLPRTPAPVAESGTSTATASISRLFTKGSHSYSTRPPSPPRQSAMKRSPAPSTPSSSVPPTPTSANSNSVLHMPLALCLPDIVVKALGSSTPSSGMSTPNKRISFAELPESYASTRPGGSSASKFKDNHNRRKGENGRGFRKEQSSPERSGWWNGWLTTGGSNGFGLSMSLARQQERMEDRTAKNWGGRMGTGFSNSLDDWTI